jgi:hypothetical protein
MKTLFLPDTFGISGTFDLVTRRSHNELKWIRKEAAVLNLIHSGTCLQGLMEMEKTIGQDSPCLGQDSNPRPPGSITSAADPTSIYGARQKKNNSMVCVRQRTIPTERPSLVGEVMPSFADRGCHVVSVTDPYGRILGFLDRSRYFSVCQMSNVGQERERID